MQQRGFTLLEVMIAMVLVGTGIALAFTAVSSGTRLEAKMREQEAAVRLARAKLDEVLLNPADFSLSAEDGTQRYAGADFGYRVKARRLPLVGEALRARLGGQAGWMEEVSIEVFWGPENQQQSYRLVTYRKAQDGASPAGVPAQAPARPQS